MDVYGKLKIGKKPSVDPALNVLKGVDGIINPSDFPPFAFREGPIITACLRCNLP
jgi:hypothetical protein